MNKTKLLTKKAKTLLFALLLGAPLAASAQGDILIDETNFPDEAFRNYLLSQSYGADGVLTKAEIESTTRIGINDLNITSFKGIELFTALTALYCGGS